ncbi:peptide-methionine (R)-S-oxide reductase [Haematococcus lacustris]|uniref:Peptide-methionine (R)-S-oxide reductase n=1 Tax=Haematococcus lacustris TaxID=44745 RepID=A0A699ZRE3_HAELA|nr:peptide-methionine (R)-S-oxide reductase [Haematococcus lacustris]
MRRSSLLLPSRSTMLASRSVSATAHQPVTRRAPCSALRPARLNIKAMATNQTSLNKSEQKFNSGCGWPAYYDNIPGAVERHEDTTHGMRGVEITCSNCGGHLGHVFEGEGFPTPTDMRHCVNSASVKFKPKE